MHTKNLFLLLFLTIITLYAFPQHVPAIQVVPTPAQVKLKSGQFTFTPQTAVLLRERNADMKQVAQFFTAHLKIMGGPELQVGQYNPDDKKRQSVILDFPRERIRFDPEGYTLKITPDEIVINATTGAGFFYGIQTLLQLLPADYCNANQAGEIRSLSVPCMEVRDHPRFPYRGMHLDVSRHFFPKEFIKKYIDLIAMYKMNRFHWHLTDDNGWRIEIKKYPKLTEIGAWHVDREDLPWRDRPAQKPGEAATYGGFYTQDDIREIVDYATKQYVTIIPEIEMPAHSVEVLAAYPQLSCTGGPFTVPPGSYWPNIDILCAGNDSVFTFLQDVLIEVMDLFPSEYIHVGGDEADKTNWKRCPKCQGRIKAEGLKDEKELQSYFMKRIEKFIISKGRKMIGWDEILEGGLAPEATVMSWRGVEGGIAAARQGHDAIMTPGSHCYFDYYQADPEFEPKAIGGLTTLKKVYSFEPIPGELNEQEAKHILGAQGNVWTEFIPTPAHAEYMAVPRMIALAEVVWSPKHTRNWNNFRSRLNNQFKRLDCMKVNYSKGSFKVGVSTISDPRTGEMRVILDSEQPDATIFYSLDGNDPNPKSSAYTEPFVLNGNGFIKAGVFTDGKLRERLTEMPVLLHLGTGKPVQYIALYSYRYPASGNQALTDGLRGSANHRDGMWQGFYGNDLEAVIDLKKEVPVNSVQTNFLQNQKSWIFLPTLVEYSLSSDGKKFHSINEVYNTVSPKEEKSIIQPFTFQFSQGTTARYLKIKAKNAGKCPEWHEGAGEPCWIFADEVVIY
jgi:hexosaminidase